MFLKSQKELTQHTFQLLDNLLSWSRYNLEQIQYKPQKISLRTIIQECLLAVRYRSEEKGVPIHFGISGDIHAFADEEMIKIIVRNLLNNAIKFTRQGQITIAVSEHLDHVNVQVTDTGVGIKHDTLEKILSDNEYVTTRGTANEAGSGLGLKLCKNFILQNKGQFHIESDAGRGSVFSFTLPKTNS